MLKPTLGSFELELLELEEPLDELPEPPKLIPCEWMDPVRNTTARQHTRILEDDGCITEN